MTILNPGEKYMKEYVTGVYEYALKQDFQNGDDKRFQRTVQRYGNFLHRISPDETYAVFRWRLEHDGVIICTDVDTGERKLDHTPPPFLAALLRRHQLSEMH